MSKDIPPERLMIIIGISILLTVIITFKDIYTSLVETKGIGLSLLLLLYTFFLIVLIYSIFLFCKEVKKHKLGKAQKKPKRSFGKSQTKSDKEREKRNNDALLIALVTALIIFVLQFWVDLYRIVFKETTAYILIPYSVGLVILLGLASLARKGKAHIKILY